MRETTHIPVTNEEKLLRSSHEAVLLSPFADESQRALLQLAPATHESRRPMRTARGRLRSVMAAAVRNMFESQKVEAPSVGGPCESLAMLRIR